MILWKLPRSAFLERISQLGTMGSRQGAPVVVAVAVVADRAVDQAVGPTSATSAHS